MGSASSGFADLEAAKAAGHTDEEIAAVILGAAEKPRVRCNAVVVDCGADCSYGEQFSVHEDDGSIYVDGRFDLPDLADTLRSYDGAGDDAATKASVLDAWIAALAANTSDATQEIVIGATGGLAEALKNGFEAAVGAFKAALDKKYGDRAHFQVLSDTDERSAAFHGARYVAGRAGVEDATAAEFGVISGDSCGALLTFGNPPTFTAVDIDRSAAKAYAADADDAAYWAWRAGVFPPDAPSAAFAAVGAFGRALAAAGVATALPRDAAAAALRKHWASSGSGASRDEAAAALAAIGLASADATVFACPPAETDGYALACTWLLGYYHALAQQQLVELKSNVIPDGAEVAKEGAAPSGRRLSAVIPARLAEMPPLLMMARRRSTLIAATAGADAAPAPDQRPPSDAPLVPT